MKTMTKRLSVLAVMLMAAVVMVFAQDGGGEATSGIVIDLGTFAGITAVVSALVTQILKLIPKVQENKLAKIGISAGVGLVVCVVAWLLQIAAPLEGLPWWQTLLYGLASGLSGCGFYDLVKAVAALFIKKDE